MTVLNAAGLDPLKSWTWCVLSLVWGTALQTRDAGGCGVTPGVDVGLLPSTPWPRSGRWLSTNTATRLLKHLLAPAAPGQRGLRPEPGASVIDEGQELPAGRRGGHGTCPTEPTARQTGQALGRGD